jgi:hypothetical protein
MPPVAVQRFQKPRDVVATHKSSAALFISLLSMLILLTAACDLSPQGTTFQKILSAKSSRSSENTTTELKGHLSVSAALPRAKVGTALNTVVSVSGGSSPYQFAIGWGSLAPGLSLNPKTGTIFGTPLLAGTYQFSVLATDLPGADQGDKRLTLTVDESSSGTTGIIVTISPSSANLASGATQQFTATVRETSDTRVTWSASAGTISNTGLFTAPIAQSMSAVAVTATSVADTSKHASAAITVTPSGTAPVITTNYIPAATAGLPYATVLLASGGKLPYSWSIVSGSLPQGLQLDGVSGTISGTTAQSGNFSFTAKVTDSASQTDTNALTLSVSSQGQGGGFDGPAELPRVYIQSSLANTPAPGKTIPVNAGGNFQSALTSASCGDTITLQAGATFTGIFTLPAKGCDDNHWIIVRTSAADSSLPAEGTRITPCYAGVTSLPGRPALNCGSSANVMAKVAMSSITGSGPIQFATGASHYRLLGLEVTRQVGGSVVYNLASVQNSGSADHLIFDRVWMHGTPHDDTNRGVALSTATDVAVVDSFFTDFHCESMTGSCTDAQAIMGGVGNSPMGPYKIVNNFLEAAAEAILFGGGGATVTPTDVEVRRNHMFKPMTWKSGQPGFVGGPKGNPFIVKNHFELKNAQRVLFEGNILENTWGGFSQNGFSILLTPKNQNNVCPLCQVTDVTIRFSTLSHAGAGLQIANALSDAGGAQLAGERYSIHDITADDIDPAAYAGSGIFAQVSMSLGTPVLRDVSIDHVTAFAPNSLFLIGDGGGNQQMSNFIVSNSIVNAGTYPVWSTGEGGANNCAAKDIPLTTFNACFNPYTFGANAVIASKGNYTWPVGTSLPASVVAVQFVNYNNGKAGDYHLQSSSPYKNLGSDGKDLGADVDAVLAATAGVR